MTGMDQFLAQHYGSAPVSEPTAEDVEKVAQAEFFLKLASENGVDVNSLDDAQVNQLWDAVWNQQKTAAEKEEKEEKEMDGKKKFEAAKKEHEEKKEAAAKIAEAEQMGKIMAHTFVQEQQKIASTGGFDFLKQAFSSATESKGALDEVAARFALEKAAAAGFDANEAAERVQAVLTLGPGESEKIAYVQDFNSALDVRSSELLEAAGYPIDWSGTPFDKTAYASGVSPVAGIAHAAGSKSLKPGWFRPRAAAKAVGEHLEHVGKAAVRKVGKTKGEEQAMHKGTAKALGGAIYGGGASVAGGAAYGGHKAIKALRGKKEEQAKESSAQFDIDAGNLAVEKVASAGWNADEAVERLNAVLTLGAGDPAESEKVAAAQTAEQQLDARACELLEMAGYTINWA